MQPNITLLQLVNIFILKLKCRHDAFFDSHRFNRGVEAILSSRYIRIRFDGEITVALNLADYEPRLEVEALGTLASMLEVKITPEKIQQVVDLHKKLDEEDEFDEKKFEDGVHEIMQQETPVLGPPDPPVEIPED